MSLSPFFDGVIIGLKDSVLHLIAWTVAVVLAVVVARRRKDRAEWLLAVGMSLMLLNSLVGVFLVGLGYWLADRGYVATQDTTTIGSRFALVHSLITLAGIICLIGSFWIKFKVTSNAQPES